jgi:4-hydroxy-3-polyprenylbenzoate decarboxylase
METKRKIIVAVTGASGAVYAETLLERIESLQEKPKEVALVFTKNAEEIWQYELASEILWGRLSDEVTDRRSDKEKNSRTIFKVYDNRDFFAPFASGSSKYDTMIICPASMGILGRIANGVADDLISRAADVMLKERRKLILVPRETPYNLIHINNMKLLTEAGAIILPATPSFYSKPTTIKELVLTVVDRILDIAGFDVGGYRWGDLSDKR